MSDSDSHPGLLRLQQAVWQDACPDAPPLAERVSPDLTQAALLVRPRKPALQVSHHAAGSAIKAFVPLPAGSRPFRLPSWDAAGEHVSQLYETGPAGSREIWGLVLRPADQITAKARLESLPAAAPKADDKVMTTAWAPRSPTLLVARRREQGHSRQCHRRSRLKAVGCELVYLDTEGGGQAGVLWSPDEKLVCYTAADTAAADKRSLIILHVGRGTAISAKPACGEAQVACFSPSGSHLLVAGNEQEGADRAVFIAASDAARVLVEVKCMTDIQHLAWASRHVAIASGDMEAGMLVLYAETKGPGLQLLHVLDMGAYTEDLAFSPCGHFLAMLDQGSFWVVEPAFLIRSVKPESEVVVMHLPTLQTRRFGSRGVTPEQMRASVYHPPRLHWAHCHPMELELPARAKLWWQGSQLLSYGPGTGTNAGGSGPHTPIVLPQIAVAALTEMPCSYLDLG